MFLVLQLALFYFFGHIYCKRCVCETWLYLWGNSRPGPDIIGWVTGYLQLIQALMYSFSVLNTAAYVLEFEMYSSLSVIFEFYSSLLQGS